MQDVYAHIDYFIKNFGDDNIGVGTDFFGTENLPAGLETYADFENFRVFLCEKGLSNHTIDKLFFKNAERFVNGFVNRQS